MAPLKSPPLRGPPATPAGRLRSARTVTLTLLALVAALIAAPPIAVRAQSADAPPQDSSAGADARSGTAALEGRVVAHRTGAALAHALVVVEDLEVTAETDGEGHFVLTGLRAGEHRLLVRHLGRESGARVLELAPETVHRVSLRLVWDPVELRDLRVEVEATEAGGKLRGFRRRRRLHPAGRFIGREEIERRDPEQISDLFYAVPGVSPRSPAGPGERRIGMNRTVRVPGRDRCRVRYVLDGMRLPDRSPFHLDQLPPEDVAGIEIYRGVSEVPPRFARVGDTCGVIAVWTRDPDEAASRP